MTKLSEQTGGKYVGAVLTGRLKELETQYNAHKSQMASDRLRASVARYRDMTGKKNVPGQIYEGFEIAAKMGAEGDASNSPTFYEFCLIQGMLEQDNTRVNTEEAEAYLRGKINQEVKRPVLDSTATRLESEVSYYVSRANSLGQVYVPLDSRKNRGLKRWLKKTKEDYRASFNPTLDQSLERDVVDAIRDGLDEGKKEFNLAQIFDGLYDKYGWTNISPEMYTELGNKVKQHMDHKVLPFWKRTRTRWRNFKNFFKDKRYIPFYEPELQPV